MRKISLTLASTVAFLAGIGTTSLMIKYNYKQRQYDLAIFQHINNKKQEKFLIKDLKFEDKIWFLLGD